MQDKEKRESKNTKIYVGSLFLNSTKNSSIHLLPARSHYTLQ